MQVFLKTALSEKEANSASIGFSKSAVNWQNLVWFLLCMGVFVRVFHFFENRSLWRDEIYLATSLIEMNIFDLIFSSLEYEQKAPIGFLWFSKLGVLWLGKQELGLRLVPLLSGIVSLFVFLPVARYFLKPLGVVVAMGVLVFAPPLVFHAVEAKQYSTELLATIVVLYLFIRFHKRTDFQSLLLWGGAGVLVLCFSLSSIFVLAGIAIALSLLYLFEKNWTLFFQSLIPFSMWCVGFIAYYLIFLSKYSDSGWLEHWFRLRGAFMPLVPSSLGDIKWFVHALYDIQRYPLGLMWIDLSHPNPVLNVLMRMPFLALVFFMVGIWAFFSRSKKWLMVLIFPVILTLLASALEAYPFYERLIVFLAPVFIIFLAGGCVYVVGRLNRFGNYRYLLPALLLATPVINSARQIMDPSLFGDYKRSQQRSALLYIDERYQDGDQVYVNWNSLHAYRFYKNSYNLKFAGIEGNDPRFVSSNYQEYFQHLQPDIKQLEGHQRVWVLYHKRVWDKIGDFDGQPEWYYEEGIPGGGELLREHFLRMGKEIDSYQTGEFSVSLFDLSVK